MTRKQRVGRTVIGGALALSLAVPVPVSASAAPPRADAPGRDPFVQVSTGGSPSAKLLPRLAPTRRDALRRALDRGRLTQAEYALARARSLFHPRASSARFGDLVAPGRLHATLVLRDLLVRIRQLRGEKRERALALLARPTEGDDDPGGDGYSVPALNTCSTNVCVTWVATTPDAPNQTDSDVDAIPDWIEQTTTVMEEVWALEITKYGFRPPKSDETSTNHGPDARLDVYVADIGSDGLYGYCTSDDPNQDPGSGYEFWDVSAYCVVDNDYQEFPQPGLPSLQVTAAHEFFHAVQFAYDAAEDPWFMEGTASWMEDEVYTDVNDNHQYLADSPLRQPDRSLDFGTQNYLGWYGSWIFWRFLSEYFGEAEPDPSIVREAWEQADGAPGAADRYSTSALQAAMEQRQWELRRAFADFGVWNATPALAYSEGAEYPTPPFAGRLNVRASTPVLGPLVLTMDHLTSGYVRLKAGAGVGPQARIRVEVDGPNYGRGPEATLIVFKKSGAIRYVSFELDAKGDGVRRVPIGTATIASVTLVLTNASIRFRCWQGTKLSCQGEPKDDGTKHAFTVTLVQ